MSNQFLHLVGRLPPELLSFERFHYTFIILALGMFNQNFDIYFYRVSPPWLEVEAHRWNLVICCG